MSIPAQFQLHKVTDDIVAKMCGLCDQIERGFETGDDIQHLLDEWHLHANRRCEQHEFENYWRSIDKEEFVRDALNPEPRYSDDVRYADALAILDAVVSADLGENETTYYVGWLEAQFPNANFNDLIYWPDEWFADASLFRDSNGAFKPDAELSNEQILAYAMLKSGRLLPDRPLSVDLPFQAPT